MSDIVNSTLLERHWVHSHEEDTGEAMVFRPSAYDFPLSRGRVSMELKPGGDLVETGIAPTDRKQRAQGKWKLEDDNRLALYIGAEAAPSQVLKIASVGPDRLVIKKGDF